MGFKDYMASQAGGIWKGVGDVIKSGAADIGDTYQELLLSHSVITPPDGLATPSPEPATNVRVSITDNSTHTHNTYIDNRQIHSTNVGTPNTPPARNPSRDISLPDISPPDIDP